MLSFPAKETGIINEDGLFHLTLINAIFYHLDQTHELFVLLFQGQFL